MTFLTTARTMRGMTSGMDLRLERVAQRVAVKDIAARMGRSTQTVHRWEGQAVVDPSAAAEYRAALVKSSDDVTFAQDAA